jgi:hypothetical protein
MNTVFEIIAIIAALIIALQDFRSRTVSAFVLLLLFAALLASALYKRSAIEALSFAFINIALVVLQMGGLTLYFSLKNKELTNIFDSYIGWGDIALFLALAPVLAPLNFVLLFLGTTFIGLVGFILAKIIRPKISREIPLAGVMALMLCMLFVLKYTFCFSFYDDSWLLNFARV